MATSPAVREQVETYARMTPSQIALALAALSRALQKLSDDLEPLEKDSVEKREAYTLEYAKTFLDQDGPVEEKKQRTLYLTHDHRLAAELAESLVKMHEQQINTLKKRMDIARSAAALVRAEWELEQAQHSIRR